MSVLVLGTQGQLNTALCNHLQDSGLRFLRPAPDQLELTDAKQLESYFASHCIHYVINTTSHSAPCLSSAQPSEDFAINRDGAAKIAKLCEGKNAPLIHLSNWQVFDGLKTTPYFENDKSNPQNSFGNSCWQGEEQVRQNTDKYIILRLSWLLSSDPKSYVGELVKKLKNQQKPQAAKDYLGSPTLAEDAARVIVAILQQLQCQAQVWGTYHYVPLEILSELDLVKTIARQLNPALDESDDGIEESYCNEVHGQNCSINATLDGRKICHTFGIHPRPWQKDLEQLIAQLDRSIT